MHSIQDLTNIIIATDFNEISIELIKLIIG